MLTLRKIGKLFAGFLFTTALVSTLIVFSPSNFTQHDTVKGVISNLFQQAPASAKFSEPDDRERFVENLKSACEGKETISINLGQGDAVVKCSDVSSLSSDRVMDFVSATVVDNIYYKKYDCDFASCVASGEPLMPLLITELAHKFYEQILIYAVIVTIIFGALYLLAIENNNARMKSLGFSLIWPSASFIVMNLLIDKLLVYFVQQPEVISLVKPTIDSIFSSAFLIYTYLLIAGIVLVAAGYLVKPENFRFAKKNQG